MTNDVMNYDLIVVANSNQAAQSDYGCRANIDAADVSVFSFNISYISYIMNFLMHNPDL